MIFKDTTGRTWELSLSVAAVKRVRSLTGIDLLPLAKGGDEAAGIAAVLADPIEAANVIYAAAKPQADAAGMTDEAFGELLAGQVLADAVAALLDALEVFFAAAMGPDAAAAWQAMRAKRSEMTNAAWKLAKRRVEAIDAAKLVEASGQSYTAPLESRESTPTR